MDITKAIGNTPIIKINDIYAKLEFMNPSGSIKDRAVKAIIQAAEIDGTLTKDKILVECSSGNTGVSMAMIAAAKGYKAMCVIPKDTSNMKINMMKMYGCDLIYVKKISDGLDLINKHFKNNDKYFYLNQFNNINNVLGQYKMAHEAYIQLNERPNAIVAGMGTGGTLAALAKMFTRINSNIKIYTIRVKDNNKIEGLCDGVELPLAPKKIKMIPVSNITAKFYAKLLARRGLFVGLSSGANYHVASMVSRKYGTTLTVFPDTGMRYIDDFND